MDPAPIRRWNPGFIALRWRHLFWGLPLLGLLIGLVVYFLPMIRNTATGVVQKRPGALSFSTADVVHAVHTDDVLALTGIRTDLTHRWNLEGRAGSPYTEELRRSVSAKPIPGTALVEISVSGRSRAESKLIWHALVTALQEHLESLRSANDQTRLDQLEAAVERQKAEVETKRRALPADFGYQDLKHRNTPLTSPPDFRPYRPRSKEADEFESSQQVLEQLQIKFISEKMQLMITDGTENPIWIHEAPGSRSSVTLWDTLRPLVLHSSIGLGAGMVLAVVLAYLLELLFPRKSSAS